MERIVFGSLRYIFGAYFLGFSFAGSCIGDDFNHFANLVYQVSTKTNADSSILSSGTGFVVDKNGLLITNFHVISLIFRDGRREPKNQIWVMVGSEQFQAEVVKFDIFADLALLKIPYTFSNQASISQTPLNRGEHVYSLGFHENQFLAINQGTFNDYLRGTENELMALSVPLNPGMSGGPILNSKFEVVGVNDLKNFNKESSGYGVNANRLAKFLEGKKYRQANLEQQLHFQIKETYSKIESIIYGSRKAIKLNNWKVDSLDRFMNCREFKGEENIEADRDVRGLENLETKSIGCQIDYRMLPIAAIGDNFELAYSVSNVTGRVNTKNERYYYYLSHQFHHLNGFRQPGPSFVCSKSTIKNRNDISFRISLCAFKHKTNRRFSEAAVYI